MSNRTLAIAVSVLLVLGVLLSAVVVMQNQQLMILADSVQRLSDQAERTFDVVQKRAMEDVQTQGLEYSPGPSIMDAVRVYVDLGVAIAVPQSRPGWYEVEEEEVSFGSDERLPTAVVRISRAEGPLMEACTARVFIGDKDYRGEGSGQDRDMPLIEDPDRFHVYGPEDLCGASIIVLPQE